MKHKNMYFLPRIIGSFVLFLSCQAMALESVSELRHRTQVELQNFTEMTGMVSNFRSLAPASSLGVFGFDTGIEFTSIPQGVLQLGDQPVDLPPFFPRLYVAKGITPNFDIEVSLFVPKWIQSSFQLPEGLKDLWTYSGALKYTLFEESMLMPVSVAVRATYTRLNLDFYNSDTYGADVSISRKLKLPLIPFSVTPFAGLGYVSIHGEFESKLLNLLKADSNYSVEDYRYFTGLSLKLFFLELTGQADFANPKEANTYSVKLGIDF